MEPITKDFLTTLLATSFGAFRIEMKEEFQRINDKFDIKYEYLAEEIRTIQRDIKEIKEELKEINLKLTYAGEKVFDNHEPRITKLERRFV